MNGAPRRAFRPGWTAVSAVVLVMWAAASGAAAQTPIPARGSSVAITAGLAGGGSLGSGAAVGASVTVDLAEPIALEGTATYFDRGEGAEALAFNVAFVFDLLRGDRRAVPYAVVGGGVYRAWFDLDTRRFLGAMRSQYPPGTLMVPLQGMAGYGIMGPGYMGQPGWMGHVWDPQSQGAWPGPTMTLAQMPMFYAARLGPLVVPENGRWGTRAFTDPALTLGGGVRLDLTRHLSVRPDLRAVAVISGGDAEVVTLFSFHVGYRF